MFQQLEVRLVNEKYLLLFLSIFAVFLSLTIVFSAPISETENITIGTNGTVGSQVGTQGDVTLANGASCTANSQCSSAICLHNVCRSSSPFCGDGFCDAAESCSSDNSACSSGSACTNGCVATTTTTTTTAVAAPSGGGGGGGGGGGAAPGPIPTASEASIIPSISAGGTGSVPFTVPNLVITGIDITVTNSVNNVQITVTRQSSAPATVPAFAVGGTGAIHSYLIIEKKGVQDSDITNVKIKFKVEKSWLSSNGVDKSTIVLSRFNNGVWNDLPTFITGEDSTYVYFESISPGLSVFVITGQKGKVPVTTTTTTKVPTVTPTTTTTPITTTTVPPLKLPELPQIPTSVIIVIIVVIIIGFIIFRLTRSPWRMRHTPWKVPTSF